MATVFKAPSLDAAVTHLRDDPSARPIAGGVGVLLDRALGRPTADTWVSVGRLPELRERRRDGGEVVLGAALTLEELGEPGDVPIPGLLAAAARSAANPGIRVVATIGGNVAAGGAASDLVAALVALDARAELVGPVGARAVAVESLVARPVAPRELIRAFRMPAAQVRWGWQRLTIRGAMDRSSASVAVALGRQGARVAVTFVAGRPLRLPSVEADPDPARARSLAARDLAAVDLLDDDRAPAEYRRRVVPVLVERALERALGSAENGG